jgi:hypothetical protein
MGRYAHLDFRKYIFPLHALHLLNVLLIYLVARKLKLAPFHACAAALFFAINMAVFDVFWKPMYVFDLLCATFCLASLLLYASGRWILSLIAFWFAYKAKEVAVMLPAVLLLYEIWFGKRQWLRLVPFFAISLSFGLQGLFLNPNKDNAYTFRFNLDALQKTVPFYSSQLFFLPYAGLAFLCLPLLIRERRVWFGVAAMIVCFFPLMFLPGRVFPAYCYVPLVGGAIAIGAVSNAVPPIITVLLFGLWIPWNIHELRIDRRATLAAADEDRPYVAAMIDYAKSHPHPPALVYYGAPLGYHDWGVTAAWNLAYGRTGLKATYVEADDVRDQLRREEVALLGWDPLHRKVSFCTRTRGTPYVSYLTMNQSTPLWQLEDGWFGLNDTFRWIKQRAVAVLHCPANGSVFELHVNLPEAQIDQNHHSLVKVLLDGTEIGSKDFVAPGLQTAQWALPVNVPRDRDVRIEFDVSPEFIYAGDPRHLGIAVTGFGFTPVETK